MHLHQMNSISQSIHASQQSCLLVGTSDELSGGNAAMDCTEESWPTHLVVRYRIVHIVWASSIAYNLLVGLTSNVSMVVESLGGDNLLMGHELTSIDDYPGYGDNE